MKIRDKSAAIIGIMAAGVLTLTGCSGNIGLPRPEENSIPSVSETEEAATKAAVTEAETTETETTGAAVVKTTVAEEESGNLFAEMPAEFYFSSGAGGWSTDIEISPDGTFTGVYHDSDMGDTGEGYPNGTLYLCSFSGKFSEPQPTDQQHIYSMRLLELNIEDEEKVGTEEIVDETLYIYTTPYGFDDADEFLVYTPGAPVSEMSEECLSWTSLSGSIFTEIPEGYYVLYNVSGQEAFNGVGEDTIWNRDFRYENGDAYATFSPSYYMGSYLSFFAGEDAPAALALSVPWDGKSAEPMVCEKSWERDDERFKVTVEPAEGAADDDLKYLITVVCITDPKFDFSPWGSDEPGRCSAVFSEYEYE